MQKIQMFGARCSSTSYLKSLIEENFDSIESTNEYGF